MNLKKINKVILDEIMKTDCQVKVGRFNEQVGVTVNGHYMVLMNDKDFPFNFEKIKVNDLNIKQFLNFDFKEAYLSSNIKIIEGKKECVEIKNDSHKVYINRKYLEFFDKTCTFKIDGATRPVYVYEDDVMVGLILPIRLKEGESDEHADNK